MLRRFSRNTPEAAAAIRLRRQYVWMSEQLPDAKASEEKERLNEEEISLGEWEAYQRSAERSGVPREPPSDWVPKRHEQLLLQEERAQTPSAGKQLPASETPVRYRPKADIQAARPPSLL